MFVKGVNIIQVLPNLQYQDTYLFSLSHNLPPDN